MLRAACLQSETAPKSFNFKTSLVLLCRISHRHYSKIFHREFPHKIKIEIFFHDENLRAWPLQHLLASTLSLRAVGSATVLSHKCDTLCLLKVRTTKLCATITCQYIVGTSRRSDIVLRSRSPRKYRYPLFAYPLFKRAL